MEKRLSLMLLSLAACPWALAHADDTAPDLGAMSLQNLGNVVTSVSKKPEDSFRSAAAIYVITNEDIKLSGATHIAEVLRGVPGLDVAQVDASNWAISSRGFNGQFSNKLLVLVDGRTIYTPLFSGVYWDIQNMPLEDIDRVEVIRGPGAALWGANAVNGVINIITKSAADTQGIYASTLVGNQDKSISDARYGGKLGDDFYYRGYAKYDDRAATPTVGGGSGDNSWDNAKTGFRTDWSPNKDSKVTVQGDAYNANINLNLGVPSLTQPGGLFDYHDTIRSQGANILGRWEQKHSDTLQSTFQAYVDYQSPSYSSLEQHITTYDLDYQTTWEADSRNEVVWGAGVREIEADLSGSFSITPLEEQKAQSIYNAFIQDKIALVPKSVYLTLGSKFEENSLVGFVPEPSARIAWYPDNKQTVWAAVSQGTRTPSLAEKDLLINVEVPQPGVLVQQQARYDFDSEELTAYEIGYRIKPVRTLSFDSTAYINEYDKLRTFEPEALQLTSAGYAIAPYVVSNLGSGHAYGFEESINWDVTSRWSLLANYSYINLLLDSGDSLDPTFLATSGQVPHNQFMIRSQLFLPEDVQLMNALYYVDRLPADSIDSYFRFDTQVTWQPLKGLELALVGQNLLDNRHQEFAAPLDGTANEIPRAFYARMTIRY